MDVGRHGMWGGESGPDLAHSATLPARGHLGPFLQCVSRGMHEGGETAELYYWAGSSHPCLPFFPKQGPLDVDVIDVIRFQRGKEMKRSCVMTLDMP